MSRYNINKKPVMPERCKTCPFRNDPELAGKVIERVLTDASQMCHSTGWPEGTHLCRGARDIQLRVFHAMGVIESPTDEAWDKKRKELGC